MCFKQSFPRTPIIQENLCFKTLGAAAMAGESETNKKHQFHCLLLRSFRQIQAGCIATNLSRYGDIPLKHTLKWQCLRMIDPNQLGCLICWRDLVRSGEHAQFPFLWPFCSSYQLHGYTNLPRVASNLFSARSVRFLTSRSKHWAPNKQKISPWICVLAAFLPAIYIYYKYGNYIYI